ncbi:hypothetical protein [Chitinophaga sp. YR627]|uniref:hypothetical protein n=1 Tax=Chitinophaga sp. YR627 TaxID=1881041 RepID=UPI0011609744|nr:hypothetical protein [Chitinophaga sp. YR627]
MKSRTTISFRALLLLIVFLMNTAVGFACALESGLWTERHHDTHQMHDMHDMHGKHQMDHAPKKSSHRCCGDGMIRFELLDKTQSHHDEIKWLPLQAVLFPVRWLSVPPVSWSAAPHRYVILHQHPPPIDIRVSIQSFQI